MKRQKVLRERRTDDKKRHRKIAEGEEAFVRKQVKAYCDVFECIRSFLFDDEDEKFLRSGAIVRPWSGALTVLRKDKMTVAAGRAFGVVGSAAATPAAEESNESQSDEE